jgi:TonB family protein
LLLASAVARASDGAPAAGVAPPPAKPAAAGASPAAAKPAEPEPPITVPGVEGDYLRLMHRQIHWRWAVKFLGARAARPALPGAPADPLDDPSLEAEVLFTLRWDGSPAEVTLSKSSKVRAFDAAALAAVRGEVPYPVPPLEVFGDDGVAHFRWSFARDHRLCSDGEVRRREDTLEQALPRLFVQGRTKEGLLRVARHMRDGDPEAMAIFARAWLTRPFADPAADVYAAAALARAGDRRQIERVRRGLAREDTVAAAAQALTALKADLCGFVQPMLADRDAAVASLGVRALRAAAGEGPPAPACVQALSAMAGDPLRPPALRGEALQTFAALDYAGARRMALAALEAPEPAMRAAGARAFARPEGGRPSLYRLEPVLHDPSPEVRAAAAWALVRSCGDLARDYLMPLFKDKTAQPLVAMAPELGRQASPGSAELLGKMLKRNDRELRLAVLAALSARRDAPGRALFQPLADHVKKDPYAGRDERLLVFAAADADELLPLARDPVVGMLAFRALLRARRHQEAADWLVAAFDRLGPAELVDAFAAWLASPPPRVTATSRADGTGG